MSNNVNQMVLTDCCVQCGTCESICPHQAIEVKEYKKRGLLYPHIESNKCISCSLCLKVCPVNYFSLLKKPLKNFRHAAVYSVLKDDDKEKISPSGGTVSAIVKYLFEHHKVQAAIVTIMSKDSVTEPKGVIIKRPEEVDEARGSIYQPVALNKILKEITSEKKKIAYVGLPCHMQGLANYTKYKKELKDVTFIKIGLLCNIGRARNAARFLLHKYARNQNVKQLYYRRGQYPGALNIITDKKTIVVPYSDYMAQTGYLFPPKGCLFCDNLFNEEADISVGDPWNIVNEKKAMIITMSQQGEEVVSKMKRMGIIKEEICLSRDEVIKTQNYKHKENRVIRATIYNKLKVKIPTNILKEINNMEPIQTRIFQKVLCVVLLVNSKIFNSAFYFLAGLFPHGLLKRASVYVKGSYKQ